MGARLALETLRRPARGTALACRRDAAAARRCPASSSGSSTRAPLDALAARLPQGVALVSATNGKTTTTAMASAILSPTRPPRLEPLRREPRLGRRVDAARARDDADLGLLEVDEFALPEVMRRTPTACRVPRQPLPRPARPLRRARAHRRALAGCGRRARCRDGRSSPTPTIRSSRRSQRAGSALCSSASTILGARAAASSTPPTRSTAFAAVTRTATTPRTSDISAPTGARRAATHGPRSTSSRARSSRTGSTASRSCSTRRTGSAARAPGRARPLQRVQRARRRVARALARRRARRRRRGAGALSGRPSGASSGSRSAIAACCCCSSRTRPARTRRSGRSRTAASPRRSSSRSTTGSPTGATSPGSGTSTSSPCSSGRNGSS